jgi:hypothetical protein
MKAKIGLLVLTGVLFAGITAAGHHSIIGTYDFNKEIKLDGKLVQVQLRNPHSFIHVEAPDDKGVMKRWALEWGGAGQLVNQGVDRNSLKVGDQVVVTGNPARNGDTRMRLTTIRRPSDGFGWGTRPGEVVD